MEGWDTVEVPQPPQGAETPGDATVDVAWEISPWGTGTPQRCHHEGLGPQTDAITHGGLGPCRDATTIEGWNRRCHQGWEIPPPWRDVTLQRCHHRGGIII